MVRRALLACLVLLLAGCAAHQPAPLVSDLVTPAAAAGLGEVRHRDELRAFLIVAMVVALAFVIFVDLCLLPFSHRRRHLHFPCCRAVIHFCIH
jgi:hypothetical protein